MDGVLLVDKPAGWSSHDVVAAVRRTLPRGVKVGHGGTLDPFATGLLLVLLGRATRLQRFLLQLPKTYVTVARLGWTSTTGDPEGELTHTGRLPADPPALPTGLIRQRPPAHSAVKIGGRRAYAMARAGEEVEVPEREVRVDRFEQRWRRGDLAEFFIACGSGTYVRSLVAALGDAYCVELRRTTIGPFAVEDATPPPERGDGPPQAVIGLVLALEGVLPVLAVDDDVALRVGHGQAIVPQAGALPPVGGHVLLTAPDGSALAVAERLADGALRPRVGLRAP